MMEAGTFIRPAVAGILEKSFVEARLHTDEAQLYALQFEMVGTHANPYYLIVDPTDERIVAHFDRALRPSEEDEVFAGFLSEALPKVPATESSEMR